MTPSSPLSAIIAVKGCRPMTTHSLDYPLCRASDRRESDARMFWLVSQARRIERRSRSLLHRSLRLVAFHARNIRQEGPQCPRISPAKFPEIAS